MIEERSQLRTKFVEEAEQLSSEIQEFAMNLWMEQGLWNAWDKLYPVKAIVKQTHGRRETLITPLYTIVFRTAMFVTRERVSAQAEAARNEQAENARTLKKEQSIRRELLAHVSAAPREDAEKSIEQRMRETIQPFSTRLMRLEKLLEGNPSMPASTAAGRGKAAKPAKRPRDSEANPSSDYSGKSLRLLGDRITQLEQLMGNAQAPMAADPYGDASQSAERSHLTKANQDPSEKPISASDSEKRKKKWKKDFKKGRRAHEEVGHAEQPTNQDQARKPGQGNGGNLLTHVHQTFTDGGRQQVQHVTP